MIRRNHNDIASSCRRRSTCRPKPAMGPVCLFALLPEARSAAFDLHLGAGFGSSGKGRAMSIQALALVDVKLLDHFIIGGLDVVSLAERGIV